MVEPVHRKGVKDDNGVYHPGYTLKNLISEQNYYTDDNGQFLRGVGQPELPEQYKFIKQTKVQPRKIFKDVFFATAWEQMKDAYKEGGFPREALLHIYAKAFPLAYRTVDVDEWARRSNTNLNNLTESQLSKKLNSDEFVAGAVDYLREVIDSADSEDQFILDMQQIIDGVRVSLYSDQIPEQQGPEPERVEEIRRYGMSRATQEQVRRAHRLNKAGRAHGQRGQAQAQAQEATSPEEDPNAAFAA
jgi:hypothetical protein